MKIAKYLFLLLLLCLITISVFVATKDGSYTIKRTKLINVPRQTIYKYLTESGNWDSINPWDTSNFKLKKTDTINNKCLTQYIVLDDKPSVLLLQLQDTLNKKTIVTWSTSGKKSFQEKFLSIINKGTASTFSDKFDQGLATLNKILTREINTYTIKLDGFVKLDTIFYIQRPVICKDEEIPNKIKHFLPILQDLLNSTNTVTKGAPFLIYHSKDSIKNTSTFSVAIPTQKKIHLSEGSDIYTGQINPFSAVKATVTGNYNHKKEALLQIKAFMEKNKLEKSAVYKPLENISVNITTNKLASQWVTQIFIPVRPKKAAVIKPKTIKKDTIFRTSTATN